jgi:hypothetical protein
MQKAGCNEAIPLMLFGNGRRVEDKIIHYFLVVEPAKRNKNCNDNND